MLSFIGMCFSLIFGTLLTADGDLRILNIFSFIAIIINVGLNFLLIPKYGAEGAGFTAFCTQCFIAGIQFIYCSKRFCFKFTAKAISKYVLFICAIVGIFLLTEFLHLGLLAYAAFFADSLCHRKTSLNLAGQIHARLSKCRE